MIKESFVPCQSFVITAHDYMFRLRNAKRPDLTFVSTSWRHPWDPTLEITLRKISAIANTTPIVTTVTKPTTKEKTPREADATPRVNIQDFCEEHYEDILLVIMNKIRRDKRKEVIEGTTRSTDSVILTRQAQLNPDRTEQIPEIILAVEAALTGGALLAEIVLGAGTALAKPLPLCEKGGEKVNLRYPAYRRAALAMEDTGSPSKKGTDLRMRMTFNSTLIGTARVWFDELPPESIDGYKVLKGAFLAYFMQQKKYVKDPVKIHNIKQSDGETIEEFMERSKVETGRMKGASECMRISGFMHRVNNPELTKRLNEHVPKTMEEMMIATTAFIRGEAAAAGKKKGHTSWRAQQQSKRQASERRSDFRGKFKPPPPMVTSMEKRSSNKFCDFHNDKGHSTVECMQLKKKIEELVRAGKLSHLIKEIKQGRDQPKARKKEVPTKDKSMAIYMIQPWHKVTRQKVTQSFERVSEITFPSLTTSSGTEGPLVIEEEIGGHMIHRMYVDEGSSTEVLYEHCFNRLRPEIKSQMVPATTSLTGFSGETIWPLGQLRLLVTIGDADHSIKAWMNFMIVRSLSPYNGIIGRPGIREIQAVPSTAHGMLKFPADGGIVTIRSTILIPAECATVTTSSKEIPKEAGVRHENFKVAPHPNFPDQEVAIGGTISAISSRTSAQYPGRIFARSTEKKGQAPERAKAIQAEVQKLVKAGIMREVYYHDWLSNPVMVKKHDGSWRMCVDFTDLNKACPQDCYPLPEIDWKVESLYGYPFKCFLDAYKGYHQIQMAESDEEKTTFHTSQGVYCYTKMPFGLKNAGATYQRLVDKAFDSQVGRNIEVYVDDLVIKSHTEAEMLRDIDETFRTLRKINMKLNPKKCTFGAVEGMFLGYMITPEGIKPCPSKTEAVLQLPSPRTIKEVQSLNGKLASLNRFLSKSAEKSLPLFKTLKKCIKKSDFHWTPEAEQAFKQLKQHLSELPLLVAPKPKEELIVYLSASNGAISAVLMTERGTVQTPVYFVSRAFQGPKLNYTPMEKLVLSLVFAAKRLQRTITKIERHAGGTQYHIPSKNVGERTDPDGLPYGCAQCASKRRLQTGSKPNPRDIRRQGRKYGQVLVEILKEKPIQEEEVATVVEEEGPTWMTPIMEYLKDGTLPSDRKEVSKLRIKARHYELGVLYKRSFLKPWLRCVGPLQSDYVIREIHEGSCSMHAGPRSVVAKAMRLGYYWPTMHRDARDMIRTCNDCQIHRPIEAKTVATITGNQVKKFVWDNIVCRFGLPGEIVSDNGKQFSDNPFKDWCEKLNITQRFASVKHPQTNGLVERANRSLGKGIKARLGKGNKNWIEELPHVLWARRTMIKSSHGDTPFSLTYGTEAVIPAEIGMPTYRIAVVDAAHNDEELRLNLDLLEERRDSAAIWEAKAKSKMIKHYNARVRGVTFRLGDFVYRSNDASHAVDGGKLGPKSEGPYEVTEALGKGSYMLRAMDGAVLPRTWNIANLKKCYL
ncbi:reverse transcriptase domain-containing protein [Tanacetum coccineum]